MGDCAYPLRNWLATPFRDNGRLNAHKGDLVEGCFLRDKLLSVYMSSNGGGGGGVPYVARIISSKVGPNSQLIMHTSS